MTEADWQTVAISIHAPREGGDSPAPWRRSPAGYFNPRPPRGGRRGTWPAGLPPCLFQSTPPARGATCAVPVSHHAPAISIHAPREGGDEIIRLQSFCIEISIHAPREGGDSRRSWPVRSTWIFQSTPPARGATTIRDKLGQGIEISIHAPREGGDHTPPCGSRGTW